MRVIIAVLMLALAGCHGTLHSSAGIQFRVGGGTHVDVSGRAVGTR